ncbi:MAG: zinc transporter ZupT [Candidatus Dactylopiibacterium carminicum]|uniref:Zinc transporter ZupT n=1 Tax=Candidatus Dactylopiibacterium carminicum TaxID=857335 RepID=A0A272EVD2_9RHOO|nr:zinc transporter ZupT [Candidatus Dactylopiibacterium carminicum]KAF7600103.1 zinc transporter ZupT [Candidatus Dactylopiibacterium carminicum]PAS94067.1 MAG: zinc transporter ZupT [Candidatus Dactylopiibacterium carminicum]PAS98170.1 MAG: zinc transporter ZupT [Candidatus Dactylopiibacterium carminicum]PAT00104.1 MAG: zinc transporter ZupT [Candidatus Dactylopiibacterium carminicum]
MIEHGNFLIAFGLTLFAGLSTAIGSAMELLSRNFNPRFLAGSLGFSAGVMIYVSFVEILVKARDSLSLAFGDKLGYSYTVLAFFAGIALIALIDRLIPSYENPHEIGNIPRADQPGRELPPHAQGRLMRMGLFSALAIAIHNIPEGMVVSVPIHYATGSRRKAFWLSALSGLAEPVGALIGYLVLRTLFSDATFGVIFAAVAGIMVYVSLDELLPTAEEYGEHHIAIGGLIAGMAVMAVSLLLFV